MPNFKTRSQTVHYCLGQPAALPKNQLPTEVDVYNAVVFKKEELAVSLQKSSNRCITNASVFTAVIAKKYL